MSREVAKLMGDVSRLGPARLCSYGDGVEDDDVDDCGVYVVVAADHDDDIVIVVGNTL